MLSSRGSPKERLSSARRHAPRALSG
jgi:hypothetical protein